MLYECTIFASLTLLAITIAIFVFASSIHGGALKISAEEEENLLARRRERIKEAKITELNNDLAKIDQSISEAKKRGEALTVKNMVAIPGLSLLTSIVTSGIAIVTSGTWPTIMFIFSLLLIALALYRIFRNLVIVEGFSSVMDLSTAIEQALERAFERREMGLKPVEYIRKDIKKEVTAVVSTLSPREFRVIQLRFGLEDGQSRTLEEVGYEFKVTRERVRQIETKALRKLRHLSRARRLKEYLDSIPVTGEKTGEQRFIEAIFGL